MVDRKVPGAPLTMSGFKTDADGEYNALFNAVPQIVNSVGGTANAITGVINPAMLALVAGMSFWIIPQSTNTGAVTLNLDGLGAKSVLSPSSVAVSAGTLVIGQPYQLFYNGTAFIQVAAGGSTGAAAPFELAGEYDITDGDTEVIIDTLGGYKTLRIDFDFLVNDNVQIRAYLGTTAGGDTASLGTVGWEGVRWASGGDNTNRSRSHNIPYWPLPDGNSTRVTSYGLAGEMNICRFNDAAGFTMGHAAMVNERQDVVNWQCLISGYVMQTAEAYDRIRFAPVSSSFKSGRVTVTGRA